MTTFPTINLNGSDPGRMVENYRTALDHAQKLIVALAEIRPHGRDYQLAPAGTWEKARDEHELLIVAVNGVINHLNKVAMNIIDQKGR